MMLETIFWVYLVVVIGILVLGMVHHDADFSKPQLRFTLGVALIWPLYLLIIGSKEALIILKNEINDD